MWGQKNKIRIGICLGRYLARRSTLMFIRGWGFSSSAWDLQRWRQLNTVSVSGSGSVGRTITSGTRGPWLDSSLGQILLIIFIYCVSVFKRLNWRNRCRARPTKTQIWAYYLFPYGRGPHLLARLPRSASSDGCWLIGSVMSMAERALEQKKLIQTAFILPNGTIEN